MLPHQPHTSPLSLLLPPLPRQGKSPVPKGDLSDPYPEGVLFITYSLLVTRAGLTSSNSNPSLRGGRGGGRGSRRGGGGRAGAGSRGNSRQPTPEPGADGAGPSDAAAAAPPRSVNIPKGTR
jgi:hypothetical protein